MWVLPYLRYGRREGGRLLSSDLDTSARPSAGATSWPDIAEAIESGKDTVIVVAASMERHGPHLPCETDCYYGLRNGAPCSARHLGAMRW